MAKDKPQPFTYNATLILGTVAYQVKDYAAAETFYRLHLDQAKQLRSIEGQITAYGGLIQTFYNNKKYAEAEKACKEVRDLDDRSDGLPKKTSNPSIASSRRPWKR